MTPAQRLKELRRVFANGDKKTNDKRRAKQTADRPRKVDKEF